MSSLASGSNNQYGGKVLKRANASTIQDKFMVGYQGWFTCPGDGEPVGPGHHGWLHWFNSPITDGGHPNTDLWPDVSEYSPSELYPAPGLKTQSGDPVFLFSSRNAKTVQRHFHWMAKHGVDGAFLQRFAGQCDMEGGSEGIRRIRDEVGDRVREAAEREGRVFAIMYDVVGVAPDRLKHILEVDWNHLVRNKGVLDSPNYLREKGKPVIALWGFGFDNAKHTPDLVHSITQFFRDTTPGGVYIMAGTPSGWRTAEGDADRDPKFLDVWMNDFDAISPWTVGRYSNEQEADQFLESKMQGDVELIKQHNEKGTRRKIDYIPVVLPGGSGYNMSEGHWGFNNIKRRGGRFLWKQISNAKRLGVRTIYGAMWDEYDEGTAFMPVVELKRNLPQSDKFQFMALDEDGYDCPSDWYMRICGYAAEGLRSERQIHETFPVKELQDYWSSRPKFEEVNHKSGDYVSGSGAGSSSGGDGGSGPGEGQTYQEWLASQKEDKEELPPPPYTLIVDEEETLQPPARVSVPPVASSVPPAIPAATRPLTPAPSVSHAPQVADDVNLASTVVPPVRNSVPVADPSIQANPYQGPQHYQQHYQPDQVASLAHDFSRQSISADPSMAPQTTGGSSHHSEGGRVPGGSSSPPHSMHSVHDTVAGTTGHHRTQSRPPSSSGTHSRPPPQSRQGSNYQSPPRSPLAHQSSFEAPAITTTTAPTVTPEQWPPASWTAPTSRPSSSASHQPPQIQGYGSSGHATGGASLSRPSSMTASGAGMSRPASMSASGANLSRPNSLTASGYGTNANRPNARPPGINPHTRPHSAIAAAANPLSWAGNDSSPNNVLPETSSYQPSTHHESAYNNASLFPQVGGYNPAGGQTSMPHFPTPSRPGYPVPMSNYPSQSESTYSGQSDGSVYTPWSTAPGVSPPSNPVGTSSFPGQPSRPYSPVQDSYSQHYGGGPGPTFPSNSSSSSMPTSAQNASFDGPAGGRSYQFPQATGGEGSYYGSTASDMSMPGAPSSPPFAGPSYPSQYGMPSVSYPSGAGQTYSQPSPWGYGESSGAGGSSNPPPMPPRPPVHHSISQTSTSPPPAQASGSTSALGYARDAVDKLTSKKTREQLESQFDNLTKSSNKLLKKFTR